MKIIISPAKSLNFESIPPTQIFTECNYLKQSEMIQKALKRKKPKQLMDLMDISQKLAELNWKRNEEWCLPIDKKNGKQAIYAFDGDVYTGLDAYTIPVQKIDFLQNKLRILSGLYGLLKPLDLILPYRLEMGTTLPIGNKKNLYEFWKKTLTDSLNTEFNKNDFLINLASNEYFSALDSKNIKATIITPEFKDYKDGKLKMISFFAKKARGLMVRYIVDQAIESPDEIKNFNYEGYQWDSNLSSENKWVFTR